MRRRNLTLVVGLVVMVALAAVAWRVGANVRSPDQAAAEAAPPEPSAVTATVERRVLEATVITRADVLPTTSVNITGPSADAEAGGTGVVTRVYAARGEEVTAGARVIEVSGRPVFVFAGTTPIYRTLRPGMSGTDVAQLQAGLAQIGCNAGDSATFDDPTKACVDQLYTDAGYQTVRNSPTETADLNAAEAAVVDAEDAVAIAEVARRSAPEGSELERLAVEQQRRSLDRARQALGELWAVSGPVVPFGEVVFVPSLPARVDAVGAVVGESSTPDLSGQPLMIVSSPDLQAHISIPQTDRDLVRVGTTVELLYEATGETLSGTIVSIGDELQSSETSAVPAYPAVVDADFPADWSNLNLRATLTSASTDGEVLVVPLAAVTSSADGQTRVEVERAGGLFDTVDVTTGLAAAGFVVVEPVDEASLEAGDRVVVG